MGTMLGWLKGGTLYLRIVTRVSKIGPFNRVCAARARALRRHNSLGARARFVERNFAAEGTRKERSMAKKRSVLGSSIRSIPGHRPQEHDTSVSRISQAASGYRAPGDSWVAGSGFLGLLIFAHLYPVFGQIGS